MRPLLRLLAILLLAAAPYPAAAQDVGFVPGFEDLPLMPGLTGDAEAAVHFDTPDGRIVEGRAEGAVAARAVTDFYARTLPQMGWRAAGNGVWLREGERLTIDVAGNAPLTVRFAVSPQ